MQDKQTLSSLRKALIDRREHLVELRREISTSLERMEKSEKELEELANLESTSQSLAKMDARRRKEIEQIDAALKRIEQGSYGICEICDEPISLERMKALPDARMCIQCAERAERYGDWSVAEMQTNEDEEEELTDEELVSAVWNEIETNDRINAAALKISSRNGVLRFDGSLSNISEYRAFKKMLEDNLGIEDYEDHIEYETKDDDVEPMLDSSEEEHNDDLSSTEEEPSDSDPFPKTAGGGVFDPSPERKR